MSYTESAPAFVTQGVASDAVVYSPRIVAHLVDAGIREGVAVTDSLVLMRLWKWNWILDSAGDRRRFSADEERRPWKPLTYAELAAQTALSHSRVRDAVNRLVEVGLVEVHDVGERDGGRTRFYLVNWGRTTFSGDGPAESAGESTVRTTFPEDGSRPTESDARGRTTFPDTTALEVAGESGGRTTFSEDLADSTDPNDGFLTPERRNPSDPNSKNREILVVDPSAVFQEPRDFDEHPERAELARLLAAAVAAHRGTRPTITKRWLNDIGLLLRRGPKGIDGSPPDAAAVAAMIDGVFTLLAEPDKKGFCWADQIRSPHALRDHWDQLALALRRRPSPPARDEAAIVAAVRALRDAGL